MIIVGAGLDPLCFWFRFLDDAKLRGKPEYKPSRTRFLLQSLLDAANGRGDYGRTFETNAKTGKQAWHAKPNELLRVFDRCEIRKYRTMLHSLQARSPPAYLTSISKIQVRGLLQHKGYSNRQGGPSGLFTEPT
eukprot:2800688-Pleurochrysis_carterae.AAC.5